VLEDEGAVEDAGHLLHKRLGETFVYLNDKADAIPKDVERIIKELAPDLPSDTSTSICNALTSYAQSHNTEVKNMLKAIGISLFEYCKLGKDLLVDSEGLPGKEKSKGHSKVSQTGSFLIKQLSLGSFFRNFIFDILVLHQVKAFPARYTYPADKSYKERIDLHCDDLRCLASGDISDKIMELYIK
jgi:hypothetical protein